MSDHLQPDETLSEGIRRIAKGLVDATLEEIENAAGAPEEAVHELRTNCKEMRGLLRLVRDELGHEIYKRENVFYRDLARRYSDRRDRWVFIETVRNELISEKTLGNHPVRELVESTRANLLRDHRDKTAQGVPEGFDEAKKLLTSARKRIDDWPIEGNEFETIRKSIKRVYKRGRNRMADARESPTPEARHEWRKRVKYLYYQFGFLRNIWPGIIEEREDEQKQLSDYLGDDHDLAELGDRLRKNPELADGEEGLHAIEGLIANKMEYHQNGAWPLGEKLYAEKPKHFVKRLETYWKSSFEDEEKT